jgi:hypothetical protein
MAEHVRECGDSAQCEAIDLIQTDDDAEAVRCPNPGRVIRERFGDRQRLRAVCSAHGYDSAMEVN